MPCDVEIDTLKMGIKLALWTSCVALSFTSDYLLLLRVRRVAFSAGGGHMEG